MRLKQVKLIENISVRLLGVNEIKADINSDILLQTAAIFFLTNFYLKQGIGYVYVMVDLVCMGFL